MLTAINDVNVYIWKFTPNKQARGDGDADKFLFLFISIIWSKMHEVTAVALLQETPPIKKHLNDIYKL